MVCSLTRLVEILGSDSPLGIHVVPYCSSLSGRSLGLYIRDVEEESRSRKEGLFQEDECIVKINNIDLMEKTFSQAQDIFRQAMRSSLVCLEVLPSSNREIYERSLIGQLYGSSTGPNSSPHITKTKGPPPPVKAKPVFRPHENPTPRLTEEAPNPDVSSSKVKSESPLLGKSPALSSLVSNKQGGRKLQIELKKGTEGLGFTVVTRDSSVHGPGPILVKNILPRGAAVKDGRLQSGDRILEVNGVDITGVGQEELVCMLRSTRQGETVSLVVLRQEDMFLPREMKDEVSRVPGGVSENGKEQLMFEIPLNDTGSAGLGVSLKGNKSRETGEDLGIFIKSIIHGGAAYKDGRLHINDQLIAVNGESLLGRSNHAAMETLRRSMSQEGNVRGMIQLVVLRALQDQPDVSPNCSFDGSSGLSGLMSPGKSPTGFVSELTDFDHPSMVMNSIYASTVTNGSYLQMEEEEEELCIQDTQVGCNQHSYLQERENSHVSHGAQPQSPTQNQNQQQFQHIKASKSMDLVADESNVGSLDGGTTALSTPVELGPTLGLKKSSSLESLQTAMSEVNKKSELLPFHRPRPNMVRGRGCNESFRAAIDKSYDGPAEDDDGSEPSSGRDTPASSSSRQGVDQTEEKSKKDKKKKEKTEKTKKKEKAKGRGKEKEKKKADEPEELEKKSKKIGFGILRFGKKKEEKKEAKSTLQRQKSDILSDLELDRMKEERERIEAGHPELQEKQPRDQQAGSGGSAYPDMEDDNADPNYAQIQSFRAQEISSVHQPLPQPPLYSTIQRLHARTPSPQGPSGFLGHGKNVNDPGVMPDDDPLDRLYAKVNKPRGAGAASPPASAPANDSVDRIQQLKREYQQARREGMVPPYEEIDSRRRWHETDPRRMPARGTDHRVTPRYEEAERQYASLPRRGPTDPADYPLQPWSGHYPGPPQPQQGYPQSQTYSNSQSGPPYFGYLPGQPYPRSADPRGIEPGYYPHPSSQQRGPLRQDVPPSPTPPIRGPRYETMTRGTVGGGYR